MIRAACWICGAPASENQRDLTGKPVCDGHASSNRVALEAELLELLDANESDSAATLQARGARAREIRRELDAIPKSAAEVPKDWLKQSVEATPGSFEALQDGHATRNRADELLEDARLRLCSILSAVNGIRTDEARGLVLGLRDEIERYQERPKRA